MGSFQDLNNKTIIITGGNKGIGRELAISFAGLGANIIIFGRDESSLLKTVNKLKDINPKCHFIVVDIMRIESINKAVDEVAASFGSIDVLINNAGINIAKPALEVTESDWDQVLDTNLKGTFFVSQRVAKYMREQNRGKIVNIVSQMAFVGYYNRSAYCSSKGGAVQLTKALAVEWAEYNINVNAVAPTFIKTALTDKMFKDRHFYEDVISRIPLGKLAKPSDVVGAVQFLASSLSDFITGETIRVDGGWTAI